MRARKPAVYIIVFAAITVLVLWLRHEVSMDRCLDNGGRWNDVRHACEGEKA